MPAGDAVTSTGGRSTTDPPATVPPFDQVGVSVAPGDDLVVRLPGILLVLAVDASEVPAPGPRPRLSGWEPAAPEPEPAARGATAWLGELIGLCRAVSAAGSRSPGRRLLEDIRGWLPSKGERPSFAVAAATEEGLAVALAGKGLAEVPDLGLRLTPVDGKRPVDGLPFLDRLVDWPPAALRLSAGSAWTGSPHPLADLEAGVVPGSAAVLAPATARRHTSGMRRSTVARPVPLAVPPSPVDVSGGNAMVKARNLLPGTPPRAAEEGTDDGPAGHDPGASGPATGESAPVRAEELPPPAIRASLLTPPDAEEASRDPLPVGPTDDASAAPAEDPHEGRPRIRGFLCARGHLNDPRVRFCAQCGIRMAQRTGGFTDGFRPPLGLLVFDDGTTVSVDADYLLGREPETHPRVRAAELRPLLVLDETGGVSRHHAELRLDAWDVVLVDTGSANGTLVASRGACQWSSLVPGQPVRLAPGAIVRLGGRQFTFESPHGGF